MHGWSGESLRPKFSGSSMIHKHSLTTLQSLNMCCKVHHNNRNPRNLHIVQTTTSKHELSVCISISCKPKLLKASLRKSKSVGFTRFVPEEVLHYFHTFFIAFVISILGTFAATYVPFVRKVFGQTPKPVPHVQRRDANLVETIPWRWQDQWSFLVPLIGGR